jgi:uncharacterized membrane protein
VSALTSVVAVLVLLGAALMAGVFFAFSSFIMKALGRLPAAQGIGAMQAINVVVLNPVFLGVFMGTALLALAIIVLGLLQWGHPAAAFYLGAGASYLGGTFLVTVSRNVPLNDRLAACPAGSPDSGAEWQSYLRHWTRWNHLRSVAAFAAVLLLILGLRSAVA